MSVTAQTTKKGYAFTGLLTGLFLIFCKKKGESYITRMKRQLFFYLGIRLDGGDKLYQFEVQEEGNAEKVKTTFVDLYNITESSRDVGWVWKYDGVCSGSLLL